VPIGLWAAAHPGWTDEALMRGNDIVFAFPPLLLAVLLTTALGPGAASAILAVGVFNIPVFARVARGLALPLWQREFVLAARMAGKGRGRISREHVLPNVAGGLVVQLSLQLSLALLAETGLSYIGLGTQPPQPSWAPRRHDEVRLGRPRAERRVGGGHADGRVAIAARLGAAGVDHVGDGVIQQVAAIGKGQLRRPDAGLGLGLGRRAVEGVAPWRRRRGRGAPGGRGSPRSARGARRSARSPRRGAPSGRLLRARLFALGGGGQFQLGLVHRGGLQQLRRRALARGLPHLLAAVAGQAAGGGGRPGR